MRGLSGAGKTEYVRQHFPGHVRCSADDFFVGQDGVYRFRADHLPAAHTSCQQKAAAAVAQGRDVVIDNTMTQVWEAEFYLALARDNGYLTILVDLFNANLTDRQLAERNAHGVPEAAIKRMRERYESHHCFRTSVTRCAYWYSGTEPVPSSR